MEDSSFLFWQLNCHRSKLVHDQIERRMKEAKVRPILLLQEQNVSKINGYQTYQSDTGETRSRSCILVPDEIRFIHLEDYSSADTCSGLLKCEGEDDMVVISAYMDSNHLNVDEQLIKTIELARDKGFKCLISCDSNAWSTVWGSTRSNHRESLILDLLIEYNLEIANVGSVPTFVRSNAESVIDLTIGSNGLDIDEWKVHKEMDVLSDHRLITFRIGKIPVKSEKLTRDVRTANWHKFRSLLKDSLCFSSKHYWTKADLEKESRLVTKCIIDALDVVAPLKQKESKGKPSIWSNPEYRILSNKVKAANRRRRRRPTEYSIAKYKQYRNELTDLKRKIETERWQNFVESIQDPKDLSKFAKMKNPMTKLKGLKQDEIMLTDDCDVANMLREAHFPGSIMEMEMVPEMPGSDWNCDVYGSIGVPHPEAPADALDQIRKIVTIEKVKAAIESFGSYKAAGPDGLSPIVLKNLPMDVIQRIVEMFRASLMLDYIPFQWKEASVVFIPKQGKSSYTDPKAFRPITLASFQLKTLEKLILWEIQDTTLMDNPLSKHQHAFRKHYSTDTALSVVVDKIEEGLKGKQLTIAVFLDIRGAFDAVKTEFIVECMRKRKIADPLINWYKTYLDTRTSTINVGDCKMDFRSTRGTPQGAGLSPLAFTMCIDDYLEQLNRDGTKTIAFADDLTVACTGHDANTVAELIQRKLKVLEQWSRKAGLEFNTAKSNAMIFTRKKKVKKPVLKLNGQTIEYAENIKYLGVTLTPKLNWTMHILDKVKSCKRLMYYLFRMIKKDYQIKTKGLKWLFTMCIRSKLLYAAHIWAAGKILENQKQELRKLNSLGCRLLAPCWRSTPTRTLEILWDMVPLHILAKGTALKTFNRIRSLIRPQLKGDIGYQNGHLKDLKTGYGEINCEITEARIYKRYFDKGYKVNQFDDLDWVTLLEQDGTRYVYCDGSKSSDKAGSGFSIRMNGVTECIGSSPIGKHRTVYQSELKALDLALDQLDLESVQQTILTKHAQMTEFRIDNQSVLLKLRSGLAITPLEDDIITKLIKLGKYTNVTMRWVKSHKGVQGNEAADCLAKVGSLDLDLDLDPAMVPLPGSFLKQKVKDHIYTQWQNEWDALEGTKFAHRNTRLWLKSIDPTIHREMLKLDRKQASVVIRAISGHSMIKEHLKRAGKLDENVTMECRLCDQALETNEHILACPELRMERVLAFGTSDKDQIQKHWKIANIGEFCKNEKVKRLLLAQNEPDN